MPETKTTKRTPKKKIEKVEKEITMEIKTETTDPTLESKRKILFVASEARPFIATGGLADVIGSLPQALATL